ncbi:MAG: ATP-binding protein [Chloroflexota bacterium]
MTPTLRIGTQVWPDDPFWVQVHEALQQRAQHHAVQLISVVLATPATYSEEQLINYAEEVLAQDLDALIVWNPAEQFIHHILEADLPVVYLTETAIRHPRLVSPLGLYAIAQQVSEYLVEHLSDQNTILAIGGLTGIPGDDGRSRLKGIQNVLQSHPSIQFQHLPTPWRYEQAYPHCYNAMRQLNAPIGAIFGFSDSLALAARDAGRALQIVDDRTLVVGINGDPLALAAIVEGSMTATMQTPAADFGTQALDLAVQAARGQPLPPHFSYHPRLVTSQNVADVAVQQLVAMAALPSRLVGYSRKLDQQRQTQLETGLAINQRAGLILDRQHLSQIITELIRTNYDYDEAHVYLWNAQEQLLILDEPESYDSERRSLYPDHSPVLQAAMLSNEPIFIPNTQHSRRFAPDPYAPATRARVVIPVRLGGQIMGLLDLHSYHSTQHTHHELIGLQTLADQLGIVMRNAELYQEALQARVQAEKADQLKTRLLANVSHELRGPLNIILGYSQTALALPSPYDLELPTTLRQDLQHIYRSGVHLIRLINDLLDLSRAEIDELDLFQETINTHVFLQEVFQVVADQIDKQQVLCRLELPSRLPVMQADPVRLRQILLNLLYNAIKFTDSGEIVLGAEVAPPHIHIWVRDTGRGIPIEMQERIFEPFTTAQEQGRPEGIGLGLSIARRLVMLHQGSMTLESQPGQGSTFHVYLPLPNLSGQPVTISEASNPALLLIDSMESVDDTIADLSQRHNLTIYRLRAGSDLHALLTDIQPVVLAWNLARATIDDWAIFQQIRAQPHLCHLPMILYDHEQGVGVAHIGMTGVVHKPLNGEKLLEAIDRLRPSGPLGSLLIVDDDPQVHVLYQHLLAQRLPERQILHANGGQEALDILQKETPSLIMLDLIMPAIDGFAVLEHIRDHPQTRQIPVLIISGHMLSFDDIQRLDQSQVIFQSKDMLSSNETIDTIQRALTQRDALPQQTSAMVKHTIAYIHQNYAGDLSRQRIADAVGVNKDYLDRIFQREMKLSPWTYLTRYRIKRAKELLDATSASVTMIATQVGFEDVAYFSRVFKKEVGCSPRHYREQH